MIKDPSSMDLTTSDYKKITNYYQIPKSKNKTYKELAEDVLSSKLCKCIKSVDSYNQSNNTKLNYIIFFELNFLNKKVFLLMNLLIFP